jgi:hypothetical protein
MIPTVTAQVVVRDDMAFSAPDRLAYEDSLKRQLISQLADAIRDKVEIREYIDHQNNHKVIRAELIAMSYKEFQANYGNMQQRRGISDGTMAIMQNGHWKVFGQNPLVKPVVDIKPEQVYNKKSAVDYLTERMRSS